jgi:hypothetical protein
VITEYVNKKRRQDGNLMLQADQKAKPVEMGAIWSVPDSDRSVDTHPSRKSNNPARVGHPDRSGETASNVSQSGETRMGAGHFTIDVNDKPELPSGYAPLFPKHGPSTPANPAAMQAEAGVGLPERFREVMR